MFVNLIYVGKTPFAGFRRISVICSIRRISMARNKLAIILIVAIGAWAASSCSPIPNTDARIMTLTRGINGDPESLDPHRFSSTQAGDILRDIGEGLLSYSATGEIIGGVASSWNVSADGLQYTFHIRRDARWSNGEPVTAHDFVYSFRRLFNQGATSSSLDYLSSFENAQLIIKGEKPPSALGVTAQGDNTLTVRLESPTPYFLQLLTHPSSFPVYRPAIEKFGDMFVRPGNLITNGAYRLAERVPSSTITLVRNEHYWDNANTWFDRVIHHVLDPASEVARYRAGELDVTSNVDSGVFEIMREQRPDELKVAPYLGVYYYGLNLSRPPFKNNPMLRQALSMAIDRETVVSAITRRGELPAYSFVPPGVSNYEPQPLAYKFLSVKERHEEARRLYKESGYGPSNPLRFELRYNTVGGHKNIAVAVQAMLKNVLGAEAKLVNEEFKVFISNVVAMNITESYRLSWTGDYNDAQSFLQLFESGNANNLTAYSNDEVDALMKKAAAEVDLSVRRRYLEEAERLALADHPLVPVYFFVNKHLVQPYIRGWEPSLLDFHFSKHLRRDLPYLGVKDHD
ncbi:MAG: peptide ABC transporter substrate-binding protein [Gammaproteobacteria bacterium]|nr:peptide ABC transporter substrate-binding protein [Gammaproteobacteria bacterium]